MKKTKLTTVCAMLAAQISSLGSEIKPNVLICVADDWGWPHASALGDTVVKTPVFDKLANEGALFTNAFVSSPSCTPSRNALLTGQDFYRLGEGANLWGTLDIKHPNFMHMLKDEGYEIAHYRKSWGPGKAEVGGYDKGGSGFPVGSWEWPDKFLDNLDKSKPFCYWFGTDDPHRPYDTGMGAANGIDLDAIAVPGFLPDTLEVRSDIADYYYEVERWDREVGEMIEKLGDHGVLENTIIIVTSDHGMPFPRAKSNLYDYGTRVPLVICWGDRIEQGQVIEAFTSLNDIAPTILDATGIQIPDVMTGVSLLPKLRAEAVGERDYIVFGRERHNTSQEQGSLAGYPSRAIRTNDWLLILNLEPERWPMGIPGGATLPTGHTWDQGRFLDGGSGSTKEVIMESFNDHNNRKFWDLSFGKRPPVELYKVSKDPFQMKNLADNPEHQERVKEMKAQLKAYLVETGDPRFTNEPVIFDSTPYRWP